MLSIYACKICLPFPLYQSSPKKSKLFSFWKKACYISAGDKTLFLSLIALNIGMI